MTGGNQTRAVAGLVGFACACALIFPVLFHAGGGQLPGTGNYRLQVVVPDAEALTTGSQVWEQGITVGRVSGIATHGDIAVLMLDINLADAPVYRNATAQVGARSVIGESILEIDPGTSSAGAIPNGGALPLASTDPTTQLDQAISTLDPITRGQLRRLLAGTGAGLGNGGAHLNDTLAGLASTATEGLPVAEILASQRNQVAELIDSLGQIMAAVGARGAALRGLAGTLKTTAAAVAARDRQLTLTLRQLPPTLTTVRATTAHLGSFSGVASPVIGTLATALERLAPVIRQLRPAVGDAREALSRLGAFSIRGIPLLRQLEAFAHSGVPLIAPLDASLDQTDPLLAYLSPYSRELGAFFGNLRAATSYVDATGHEARIFGKYSAESVSDLSGFDAQVLAVLFRIGALQKLVTHGYNGYPAPGQLGGTTAFPGGYTRLKPLPAASH